MGNVQRMGVAKFREKSIELAWKIDMNRNKQEKEIPIKDIEKQTILAAYVGFQKGYVAV